jgi:4-aminobutyrate aminotransferase-like enzyme/Ser/Thr protein kinase RdoA (MazF antagonist)
MMMPDPTPRFSVAEAERLAAQLFALEATATALPSERDQNFALTSSRGRFILKIAKSDEAPEVLDFQNAALAHLAGRLATVETQKLLPARDGRLIVQATDRAGTAYQVRLASWLEGELLANVRSRDAKLLASLGRALAELDAGLTGFQHAAMQRELYWDVRQIGQALEHQELLSAERRELIAHLQAQWRAIPWDALRMSVIHGDINDYNVLVRHGRVSGFIDFGDMVRSALVADPAIALAYALLDEPEPLDAAAALIAAYHERYPLTAPEIEALYPLITVRLCMTVCYAAHHALTRKGDAYQTVHEASAWQLLQRLRAIPFATAQAAVRAGCGPRAQVLATRRRLFGGNLTLSYSEPLHLVRGSMQYLYDESGLRFVDAYNNVPHVGHCHPRVVQAGAEQMARLNTNTRYLQEEASRYAETLVATLPEPLRVCFFVNSGSEANELALRLARTHTGQRDLIVLEEAYHGHTNTLVDISPYKQGAAASPAVPPWVHVASLPDIYRGEFRRPDPDAGEKYARSVAAIIEALREEQKGLAGFIAESWPSVGGQIELPPGYLPAVYRTVRAAGGVCIADEVQTAYGRLGRHFYGFEAYGVVPDIVVLGKPIGNGHPIGAVVTTPDIAASFDNGIEFFSTFGGNTVSCAIGLRVLEVLRDEAWPAHALSVGERLLSGLRALQARHELIGDVRGSGFFLGVELVRDRRTLIPAREETRRIINDLRQHGVLLGSEGAALNVLKIRPPMPFDASDADLLLQILAEALSR